MTNNNNPYNQQLRGGQMPPFAPASPQMGMPMSRRARWGKQLMAGSALIKQSLPDWFATYAIGFYAVALLGVNLLFSSYATEWYFWLFGIVWVAGFFLLSVKYSREWNVLRVRKKKTFEKKLFLTSIGIRVVYTIFIFFFYLVMTGRPHEFASADSSEYIITAEWMVRGLEGGYFGDVFSQLATTSFSDLGFPLYILLPVRMFGGDLAVFFILLINAFFDAFTALIIYRISSRNMGETIGRMAGIFCMLHPVLICYVGVTLKESIMTWLLAFFIDMADRMIVGRKYSFATIAPVVLSGFLLFMFRTVLGMVAFLAVFFALTTMDTKLVGWGKKIVIGIVMVGALLLVASDNILKEIDQIRNTDIRKEQKMAMNLRYGSGKGGKQGGNSFANYAGAAVFAPMIFTLPFPTMVVTEGQEDMRLIHGGNWMRNVMSGFVILAMFMLLLTGDWRKYTLPLAVLLGYMVVLVFSSFAHSLRFHIPTMPFEMMFAAYAIMNMRKKHMRWYIVWCMFMVVTCFAWNWMKLRGRGL